MLFGFDISSMSAIILSDQYNDFFNKPAGVLQGAIGSSLAAGSVIGSIIAGPISNKIGRRDAIAFACLWWLLGTALQTAVTSVGMLIAGRVLNGVTVGTTSSQVPVYLAEIARKEKRGSLVIIQQLAIEWGILIMYFIGYGCTFIPGPASFRTAWGIQFVPCVLLMIGLPFLPRSPRWLAKVDRIDEAIEVLAQIQTGGNREDPLVVAEWTEISETLAAERLAAPGWRKFVLNGMWKRTLAGFTVQMWQQNSGANVMTYYVSPSLPMLASSQLLTPFPGRLHLLHGWPRRQHQSHRLRCTIRPLHRLHNRHVLLHRQDRPPSPPRLRRPRNGLLPLRRRRPPLRRGNRPRRRQRQPQHPHPPDRPQGPRRHRLLLPAHHHLRPNPRPRVLDLRRRSVVARDPRRRNVHRVAR